MTITCNDLPAVLDAHGKWIRGEKDGKRADLRDADLRNADLSGADLSGAKLSGAKLSGADLRDADLRDADLRNAKGVTLAQSSPLALLLHQPGPIRAFKVVTSRYEGIHIGGVPYLIGTDVEDACASTDPFEQCAAGVNVASLDWCLREYRDDHRILIVEFLATDIASIPIGTDGKFRLHRCRVVCEMPRDDIRRALGKAWSDDNSGWCGDYELSASGDALDHIRRADWMGE